MKVERSRDLDRVLTFVDAIAAIAITLLILPLVDVANEHDGPAGELLRENLGQLGAFALSFLVILRFWWAQHVMVRDAVVDDRPFDLALMAWAFTIVFMPFPTSLAAGEFDDAPTRALYIGTMAASAIALTVLAWTMNRNPRITEGNPPPSMTASLTLSVMFVVALIIAVSFSAIGYLALLLLFLSGPLERQFEKVAHRFEGGKKG